MPDAAIANSDGRQLTLLEYWLVTLAVMSASLIQFLDMTIANVALPHMQSSLDASQDTISWVLTSFIVASAVAIPSAGWIASKFGTRRPFLIATTAFIVASMLCGVATSLGEMVAFRILQGFGAAFIAPLAQAILLDITEPAKHTRALSIWGMTAMLGPIAGPTLGGWLTDNFTWRWVFYINAPIGIPALIILWRLLPDSSQMSRRFDGFGYAMLALALASLQLMLDRGQQKDWFESGEILVEAMVAACALWIFVVHSRYTRHPLFPVALVTNRRVIVAGLFAIVISWVMLGLSAMVPVMLQSLFGYSVMQTGELMAPRGIGIFITMSIIPYLLDRLPLWLILSTGFAIVAFTNFEMTSWTLEMESWRFALNAFIQGLGLGMLMMPSNYLAFSVIPADLRTDCAGLLNLLRNISGSVSISILVLLLTRSTQTVHAELVSSLSERIPGLPTDMTAATGGGSLGYIANQLITQQAAMVGYLNVFQLLFLISLAALPLCLILKSKVRLAPSSP